jgi:predicted deacetylase
MRKRRIKIFLIFLAILFFLILTLFLVRAFSLRELDDVSPEIICEKGLLEKSSTLWIIPKYNNQPISENREWCDEILSLNKTLGMHGVSHEFREFGIERNQAYLEKGMQIFEECFGYKPTMFKPPQLKISEENRKLIEENNMILKEEANQIFHKVYHCGEYGEKRNWLISLF